MKINGENYITKLNEFNDKSENRNKCSRNRRIVESEYQRKFIGTFWNTYAFYVLYADIDKFNPTEYKLEYDKLSQMDKWALSKLNTLILLECSGYSSR